eukprot:2988376-Rhodomonas_salina.1
MPAIVESLDTLGFTPVLQWDRFSCGGTAVVAECTHREHSGKFAVKIARDTTTSKRLKDEHELMRLATGLPNVMQLADPFFNSPGLNLAYGCYAFIAEWVDHIEVQSLTEEDHQRWILYGMLKLLTVGDDV